MTLSHHQRFTNYFISSPLTERNSILASAKCFGKIRTKSGRRSRIFNVHFGSLAVSQLIIAQRLHSSA